MEVVRRLQFCAGHRLVKHEGKCRNVHGHNYVVYIHAVSRKVLGKNGLDELGRVVDFSVLKEKFNTWIQDYWDHGFIVNKEDIELCEFLHKDKDQKIFILEDNPTAENMAYFLLWDVGDTLFPPESGIVINKIVLWETENCFVEVSR